MNGQSVFNLICSFGSILSTFLMLFAFMGVFFNRSKKFRLMEVAAYGIYLFLSYGTARLSNNLLINLFSNFIMIFLITFLYESTLYRRLFATLLIIISVVSVGFVTNGFFRFNWNISLSPLKNVVTGLILFGFASTLKLFVKNDADECLSLPYCIPIAMIPVISIVVIYVLLLPGLRGQEIWVALSSVLMLILNLFVFYLYEKILERQKEILSIKLLQQQNAFYEKQFELISQSQKSVRTFRHDIKNHLTVIQSQIMQGRKQDALKYMQDVFNVLDCPSILLKTNNFTIGSILGSKILEADNNGIAVDCKLSVPDSLKISDYDLTAVIGNLMDNAIEAVKPLDEKISGSKKITVKITLDKEILFISISNPYNRTYVKDNDKSLKVSHHGLGLKSVRSVLEKYNGMMNIDQNDHEFTAEVMIYNKKAQAATIN